MSARRAAVLPAASLCSCPSSPAQPHDMAVRWPYLGHGVKDLTRKTVSCSTADDGTADGGKPAAAWMSEHHAAAPEQCKSHERFWMAPPIIQH